MKQTYKGSWNKIAGITAWLLTAVWMLVIFMLSAQPGTQSGSLSMGVTKIIVNIVGLVFPLDPDKVTNYDWLYMLDGVIRECAHGAAYFILALLAANAFRRIGLTGLKTILLMLAFCAFYAVSDEVHQLFVPGRACELFDFEVDMLGAILSLILLQFISFLAAKFRRKAAKA
jgi:VanZ family protein